MPTIAATCELEVAGAVRDATESGQTLEIVSRGALRDFGRPVGADAILDVRALSGVVAYEPEELVLTVRAGTPISEIENLLKSKNQMLAFEPADWGPLFGGPAGNMTLAGVVATNGCGSRRIKGGAVRDSAIGCRFVNGRGEAIKAGGRVIKNVTGFDLPKLMCGAFGTLGVLTEITVRVVPAPQRTVAIVLKDCGAGIGLRAIAQAAGSPVDPTGLAYLPGEVLSRLSISDLGQSGAAMIRIEGSSPAISEKLDLLRGQFNNHDLAVLDDDKAATLFRDIGNAAVLANRSGDIWRLCVPPWQAHAALETAGAGFWYADWAGGLLWLELPATEHSAARLRAITARLGGHATLMRAAEQARNRLPGFEPESPSRAKLTAAVRTAFDPRRILNRGRMYEKI